MGFDDSPAGDGVRPEVKYQKEGERSKNQGDFWNREVPKPEKPKRRIVLVTNDTQVDFLSEDSSYWLLDSPSQILTWVEKVEKIE